LWVVDVACQSQNCLGVPGSGFARHQFNKSASSSYVENGQSIELDYGSGSMLGYLGTDTLQFAGFTDASQTFALATYLDDVFGEEQLDGIMGLGWPALSEDNVTPPLQQILKQLDLPLFTVWLDRHIKPSNGTTGGLITYGAKDATNCDTNWNFVTLSADLWWTFPIDGFQVGSSSFKGPQQVISDTGTSYLGVPTEQFNAIISATNAEMDFVSEEYILPCNSTGLPDLVLKIGGKKYPIPSSEYLIETEDIQTPGYCAVAAFDAGDGDLNDPSNPIWILGDTFIRTFCNVYDIGNNRIGFAKAHHSSV
jgi:hypothetical protein